MTTRLRKTQTQPTSSLKIPVGPAGVKPVSSEETTGLRKTQTEPTRSLEKPVGPAGVGPVSSEESTELRKTQTQSTISFAKPGPAGVKPVSLADSLIKTPARTNQISYSVEMSGGSGTSDDTVDSCFSR
jgi:hypothetical protein